jgi:hypothetical protein
VQRRSDKSGPMRDDERARETAGLTDGAHEPRAEEWREQEPAGEDQPDVDMVPDTALTGGTPPGMTQRDVNLRSALARYLGPNVYPADRQGLLRRLEEEGAPAELVEMVRDLPFGRLYTTVQELSEDLGLGTEQHRF